MCADVFRAEAFAELEGEPFGHGAGVDEDEGAAMLESELGEAVVDIVPDGIGGDRARLVIRNFDAEIEAAAATDFDDGAVAVARAAEEVGDERDGVLGSGKTDALWGCWPQGRLRLRRALLCSLPLVAHVEDRGRDCRGVYRRQTGDK